MIKRIEKYLEMRDPFELHLIFQASILPLGYLCVINHIYILNDSNKVSFRFFKHVCENRYNMDAQ